MGHMDTAEVPLPPLLAVWEQDVKVPVSMPRRTIQGIWWIRDELLPLGQPAVGSEGAEGE